MSNMQAVDLLLLFDMTFQEFIPPNETVWVSNVPDAIITNTGQKIVFNVGT